MSAAGPIADIADRQKERPPRGGLSELQIDVLLASQALPACQQFDNNFPRSEHTSTMNARDFVDFKRIAVISFEFS